MVRNLLLLLVAVLGLLAGLFYAEKSHLESVKAELEANYSQLEEEAQALQRAYRQLAGELAMCQENASLLEDEKESLEGALEGCEEELERIKEELNQTELDYLRKEEEVRQLLQEIREVRRALYEDIQWFRANAMAFTHLSTLQRYCGREDLNVGCLAIYLQEELGVEYAGEEGDRLKGVEETLEEGGDCEDFTILINAYIRAMEPERLVLWKEGIGRVDLYEKGDTLYYIPDAEEVVVPYTNHTLGVCYFVEREGNNLYGHCVSAISPSAPPNIEGAVLFEPQSGQYLGRVGEVVGLCHDGEIGCEETLGNIFLIFNEEDFYIFKDGEWKSLRELYERLGEYG